MIMYALSAIFEYIMSNVIETADTIVPPEATA